ncbi:phosphotransferase family protein [Actinomyces slackii]|uniref:Phosphotransferase enzyme family n=1 Tax=Actinomyces slackii TaxID=52774 RepID=A0A3S5EM87_9ACTO|nr:aminoglycoside phosphotransferase family protein [Actinomyces slackii]VEG74941.1 Phosphotransferase enzyme family [Actinomyces slackii]
MSSVSTLAAVTEVLDAERLSELIGRPVRAVQMRVKPGVSLMLGLAERPGGRPAGWARVLWPVSASKAAKTRQQAARIGSAVITRDLAGGLILQSGGIDTDPKLSPYLRQAVEHSLLEGWATGDVLRYNPARRLVLRDGETVVRIRATSGGLGDDVHRAVEGILPAPRLHELGERWDAGHYSRQDWCGTTDLERGPDQEASRAAGAIFARLHDAAGQLPDQVHRRLDRGAPRAEDLAATHARILEPLMPELARRVRAVAGPLTDALTGAPALIHGDASPDQVLRDPADGRVWLTDFDRARLAPVCLDLGSYRAMAAHEEFEALLEGYKAAGGAPPSITDLRAATCLAELSRLAEPLRHGDPRWAEAISARLDRLESQVADLERGDGRVKGGGSWTL